eukprot:SAG11_NODE_463_length_9226_cov_21.629232_4_plen_83_part_00
MLRPPTGCSYEYSGNKCPASIPSVTCKADADCNAPHVPEAGCCSCHGIRPKCVTGVCVSKGAHGASIRSSSLRLASGLIFRG